MPVVIEGYWEDIKTHESELAGKWVSLRVEQFQIETNEDDKRRRIEAWESLDRFMVHGVTIDDSREGIYGPDETIDR